MLELETALTTQEILSNPTNLAEDLSENDLGIIGDEVVRGFETDEESRSEWTENNEEAIKLALQMVENKTFPWEGAANIKYPLLTTAAIQFAARAYPAIIPGPNLVQCKVVGFDPDGTKLERATRISKHMSYQLTEEMEDWISDMDKLLHTLPIVGSMYKKTFFDSVEGRNESLLIFPWDLVFDYWAPSVEKAPRVTHRFHMDKNTVIERQRAGVFLDDVDLNPQTSIEEKPFASEVNGQEPSDEADDTPYELLEQCRLLDLDGDGYEEPYIVTVERGSRQILRIVPNYSKDSIEWASDTEILRIKAIPLYTEWSFIPNPSGGNLAIGFGVLLSPLNNSVNTLINQLLDSGTMSVLGGGFLGSGLRLKAGNARFSPGEWKIVRASGPDIKNSVVPLPIRDPSQVLFLLLQMLIGSGERLSSITDALTGDNPPANQPATTTMAMIEQGLKVFTSIHRRIYRSLTKEYRKLYALNAVNLPAETYFAILDDPKVEGNNRVSQKDYQKGDTAVYPSADPNLATDQQRMAKVQVLQSLIPLGANPGEVLKRTLEALEIPNMEAVMQPPPPPPPDPKVQLEQAKLQMEQAKLQAEGQLDQAKLQIEFQEKQADAQIKAVQAQSELQVEAENHQMELEERRLELEKLRMEIIKIEAEIGKIQAEPKTVSKDN